MESKSREQLLREQFQEWWEEWFGDAPLTPWDELWHGDGYTAESIDIMWDAWQASRSALVVELPPVSDVESDDTDIGYNICHQSVQQKLTEQNLVFHVQGSERWITVKGEGDE